jgi:hypothetical protein
MRQEFAMRQLRHRFSLGAAALLAGSGAAFADVTADQVWASWRDFSARMGQSVTARAETRSGDRLTIIDATFTTADPDVRIVTRFSEIALRDLGDGRVRITLPPDFTVSMKTAASAPEAVTLDGRIRQSGMDIIASGDPANIHYDYSADTLTATLEHFATGNGDTQMTGQATLSRLTGSYQVAEGDPQTLDSAVALGTMSIDLTAKSAKDKAVFSVKGKFDDLGGTATGTGMTRLVEQAGRPGGLPKDAALQAEYHVGSSTYTVAIDNPDATATAAITSQDNALRVQFDATALSYGAKAGPTSVVFSSPAIPVPQITASLAGTELDVTFPIGKTDAPQDFSVVTRLLDFVVSDNVWALFDPQKVLPRDPATLILELAGTANWLVDPFNPTQPDATGQPMPLALHRLDLSNLTVSALGAALTGVGTLTFDNADLTTYPGFPKPVGEANLRLTGANALIDKLISLGFLPEDQAMGARMMLGLFARPGEGADILTSRIEAREDGTVFANGQRLK